MFKLSIIITTFNNEKTIEKTLASSQFADEIIVVDSHSSDMTLEIAKKFGAKIFQNPWPGYGPQKNFGIAKAKNDWVFHLDADEEITKGLKDEVLTILHNPQFPLYWIPVVSCFLGKPLYHNKGYNPRFFDKKVAKWDHKKVHEQVILADKQTRLNQEGTGKCQNHILHHSYPDLTNYLDKLNRYTTADAEEMFQTGKDRLGKKIKVNPESFFSSLFFFLGRGCKQFCKKYFYRHGYKDGIYGFLWALFSSYYEIVMCTKYWEKLRANTKAKN